MTGKDLRIVYMGTPDFAVEPLRCLVEGGYNVVGVVTMPDKPSGRGQKLKPSAVKVYAMEKGLNILQPERLKDESFVETLESLNVDLGIVVAFKMLPKVVWSMPKYGTFNLHASLLPDYRGAAPLNWALINGDKESGITTFLLDKDIDTGDIIAVDKVAIADEDNVGTLHDKLMMRGGKLVLKTVDMIASGERNYIPQNNIKDIKMRPAPKIFKADCKIDWSGSVKEIHNKVRGLSPYPTAWFENEGVTYKVYSSRSEVVEHNDTEGTIKSDNKTYLKVACKDGYIFIDEIQMAGKRRMAIKDFLLGNKF